MKKYFFVVSFTIYSILFLFSSNGFDYFPLNNTGREWFWIAKENDTTYKIHWEFVGMENIYIASENVSAYKIKINKTNDFFYVFSDTEYMYIYDPTNNSTKKILPRNVSLNQEWSHENYKYTITKLDNDELRVDYSNNSNSIKGYQLFKKGVGLSYIFEKNDYTSYSLELVDLFTKSEEKIARPKYEYPFITTLNPKRSYVQIGYMAIRNNALRLVSSAKRNQLDAVILVENDGKNYRVYIECEPKDQEDILRRAKAISSDAFIKRF